MIIERILALRPPQIAQWLGLAAAVAHFSTPLRDLAVFRNIPLGATCALSGLFVMLWAWRLFQEHETPICPTETASKLVTKGIFQLSRNPMYLGIVAMLLGLALAVGTLPFYLAAALFFLVIDRVFIPFEEQRLTAAFRAVYLDYRKQVRRWI